jgi:hypothetical protein
MRNRRSPRRVAFKARVRTEPYLSRRSQVCGRQCFVAKLKKCLCRAFDPRLVNRRVLGDCVVWGAGMDVWHHLVEALTFGAIGHYLPYGTIVVPVGSVVISAAAEFLYHLVGRTPEPSLGSFVIGFFSVAGPACSLHAVLRNWGERL